MDWQDFKPDVIEIVFTDIDGTLTDEGRLPAESYQALWQLHRRGILVIPVTGRPAGWCDLIARFWPVHGVVGENGALIYRHDGKAMRRHEFVPAAQRRIDREKLKTIARRVRESVPSARVAADQFCRRHDLAIDFAEDVRPPLKSHEVERIKSIFEEHGARAKISDIHVNGWYGNHDKLVACDWYAKNLLGFDLAKNQAKVAYVGDSPNDEPMFAFFMNSIGVANVRGFLKQMKSHPNFITEEKEAAGFAEFARRLLSSRET